MEELVDKGKLKRVDVLLTRSKGSLLGFLIRFGTKSYWNHALMIYVVRNRKEGYDSTFIIESGGAGIDIHNISHYFDNLDKYDVGIKRLERPWFQAKDLYYPRKVRGLALDEIDAKYAYHVIINIAQRILRQIILAAIFPWLRFRAAKKRRISIPNIAKKLKINAYICSGFVQWSYYNAVLQTASAKKTSRDMIKDVLFNPELHEPIDEDTLLSTTPADLANTKKLKWKYIIKNRTVWKINKDTDVPAILGTR